MGPFDPFKKFYVFLIINNVYSIMCSPYEYPTSTPASCASSPPPSKKRGEEGRKSACCTTMPGLTLLRPPASSWKSWAGLRYLTHHTPPTWRLRLSPLPLPQELPARPELPKLRSPQIWIGRVLRAPACGFLGARHPGSVRTLETCDRFARRIHC